MPVVHRPDVGTPLSQGDILRKTSFAITNAAGQLATDSKATYLLVVSRHCNALRDGGITVAPVTLFPIDLRTLSEAKAGGPSLDRMRRILAGIRDGGQATDNFYLGPLEEDSNKRFAAQLGTLSTVQVPQKDEDRRKWIHEHRVWRLQDEFLRDLHVRLTLTFARLGFDDYTWFSDADLDVMITEGEAEVANLRTELAEAERAVQAKEAQNHQPSEQLKSAVATKRAAVKAAEDELRPYVEERTRRKPRDTARGDVV
jgi:hypothetical protein